jgi:hypothetical protein
MRCVWLLIILILNPPLRKLVITNKSESQVPPICCFLRELYLATNDPDLKSSLEGGGPRSGGGCWPLYTRKAAALK